MNISTQRCNNCGQLRGEKLDGWVGMNAIVTTGKSSVHSFHAADGKEFGAAQYHLCGLDCGAKKWMQIMADSGGEK